MTRHRSAAIVLSCCVAALSSPLLTAGPAAAVLSPVEATRVSVASAGGQLDRISRDPAVNDDGGIVAFRSNATNVVAGDNNGTDDIFVRNLTAGTTALVSGTPGGAPGNDASQDPSISDDGTLVVFQSRATDLVAGDTNAARDVFLRDLVAGTTTRVSVATGGAEANSASLTPTISGDGNKVAFASSASNLVPGDTNGQTDIFVRDLGRGQTTRINVTPAGVQANSISTAPSLSDNGSVVAFETSASNLSNLSSFPDTNNHNDVYVRSNGGPLTWASHPASPTLPDSNSHSAFVRGDGQAIVFASASTNLVSGDTNAKTDIFSYALSGGLARVNLSAQGAQANGDSFTPSVSDDGQLIAYLSTATNIAPGDANTRTDVYVRDLATAATSVVDVRNATTLPNLGGADTPVIAGQAAQITYGSPASNLVNGDTNDFQDVFLSQATRCDRQRVTDDLNAGAVPGSGPEVVRGTPGADVLNLGTGADLACLGAGDDVVNGGADNDRIFGAGGKDALSGGGGADVLFGEAGNDSFNGGPGADTDSCDGGLGRDTQIGCETTVSIP